MVFRDAARDVAAINASSSAWRASPEQRHDTGRQHTPPHGGHHHHHHHHRSRRSPSNSPPGDYDFDVEYVAHLHHWDGSNPRSRRHPHPHPHPHPGREHHPTNPRHRHSHNMHPPPNPTQAHVHGLHHTDDRHQDAPVKRTPAGSGELCGVQPLIDGKEEVRDGVRVVRTFSPATKQKTHPGATPGSRAHPGLALSPEAPPRPASAANIAARCQSSADWAPLFNMASSRPAANPYAQEASNAYARAASNPEHRPTPACVHPTDL
ncbi:MAG: hypothetical protein WDW38_000562 [Sanguina aurantia]